MTGREIALDALLEVKRQMCARAFDEMADAWLAEAERRKAPGGPKAAQEPIRATLRQGGKVWDCDAVPRPGGLALKNCACRTNELQRHTEEPVKPPTRSDVEAQIQAKAQRFQEQHPDWSPERAEVEAWRAEPGLYERYNDLPAALPAPTLEPVQLAEPPAAAAVVREVEAKARRYREADPRLTPEQAEARAWSENPQLYGQYCEARRQ